jgi:hypothetical protein
MRKGSRRMSSSRVIAVAASLVWSVESTRWPVSAAWSAISAVSRSRISPTSTTSVSWRRMARSPLAKSRPIAGFTCIWLTPRAHNAPNGHHARFVSARDARAA